MRREQRQRGARLAQLALALWGVGSVLTILVERADPRPIEWPIIVLVWAGISAVIVGSIVLQWRFREGPRELARIRAIEDVLQRDEARETRIRSNEMVEFEEEEDEGACYAFQVTDNSMVFVSGQDFYPSAKFPNSDFSLIDIVDRDGGIIDQFVATHGKRLRPIRTIGAKLKLKLRIPDNLLVLSGKLEDLERTLE